MSTTLDILDGMFRRSVASRDHLRRHVFEPTGSKTLDLSFTSSEAAKLVDRSQIGLKKAEAEGRIPPPRFRSNGRRFYTLEDLDVIRTRLGTHRRRANDERPVTIAVQNFKGGVGKSTLSKHLGDYLGLHGYRVLMVDCDSQASLTALYDLNPDYDLDPMSTLAGYMTPRGDGHNSLAPVIHRTVWPTIDIVPANLDLQNVEYELTAKSRGGGANFISTLCKLRDGIAQVSHAYDVVIIDPPPAMGYLALNTMAAANAMLVPVPARWLDFCSTIHFIDMVREIVRTLGDAGLPIEYDWIKIVCSSYQPSKPAEADMMMMMRGAYLSQLITTPVRESSEIKNATLEGRSVYELSSPLGARETHARCRENLDLVFGEIEIAIRQQWPSHAKALAKLNSEAA